MSSLKTTVFLVTLEKVILTLAGFTISVILARAMGPAGLGDWRLLMSAQNISVYVLGLGLALVVTRYTAEFVKDLRFGALTILFRRATTSDEDRKENIRRIGHMSMLYVEAGIVVLTAFISPFRADRDNVRKIAGDDFHEIYCKCSLEICEDRDVKGLYKRTRAGEIPDFTGISSPYEEPEFAELTVDTESHLPACSTRLYDYITESIKN